MTDDYTDRQRLVFLGSKAVELQDETNVMLLLAEMLKIEENENG